MSDRNKDISSGVSDDELNGLIDNLDLSDQVYVPTLNIRKKKKGEALRPLGARIPVYMIEELKELASYHDAPLDDLIAGVLESVLEASMKGIYEKRIQEYRTRLKNRKS